MIFNNTKPFSLEGAIKQFFKFSNKHPFITLSFLLAMLLIFSCSSSSDNIKTKGRKKSESTSGAPCPYEYVLRCPPEPNIRTVDLPFTWEDLDNLESVSQGCFDGKLSYQISKMSDKMSHYLKKRYSNFRSNATTTKQQALDYRAEALNRLHEDYEVIHHPWTRILNILVDDLLTYIPGDYNDLEMTVYVVRNKDGTDLFNVLTLPSIIIFGEEYLKMLLTFNDGDDISPAIAGASYTIGHELGHRILDVSQEENRRYALLNDNANRFGKIGEFLTSTTLDVVDNPFQKREEILCDHFSLLLLAETKRIDMVDALESDRWLALMTDREMQDKYMSELMSSHPGPITRSMCMNHLVISNLND